MVWPSNAASDEYRSASALRVTRISREPGGAFLVGDPDTVAAKIRQTSEDLGGIDRLTFQMSSAASDQPAMLRSIEMLGREVKPRLSA